MKKIYFKPIIFVESIDADSDLLGNSVVMDANPDDSADEPAYGKQSFGNADQGWVKPRTSVWDE